MWKGRILSFDFKGQIGLLLALTKIKSLFAQYKANHQLWGFLYFQSVGTIHYKISHSLQQLARCFSHPQMYVS
ncbi:hypothetical protein DRN38_05880 [Thermococci archaeon]|nr:MAG: hypothetical protein DRN51_06655 [Thermococci archaeon]RLF79340.1 MAG: hypothetical protein DRN38_05880 [Thermococci archaeon]RLF85190.1 MAG: hypothetical protein DRN41_04655 [Thermococci archaeon]RLF86229.1 MAG: hypothetical protein DRN48_00965 [Thermococci archaeon]